MPHKVNVPLMDVRRDEFVGAVTRGPTMAVWMQHLMPSYRSAAAASLLPTMDQPELRAAAALKLIENNNQMRCTLTPTPSSWTLVFGGENGGNTHTHSHHSSVKTVNQN
jgi:hypothetical protein